MSAASAPGREDDFSRFRLTEMEIVDSSPTTRTKCYTSHDDEFSAGRIRYVSSVYFSKSLPLTTGCRSPPLMTKVAGPV